MPSFFVPNRMEVIELADILNVPILKAGTHHSHNSGILTISEEQLEDTIKGSNDCRELIKESLTTGKYRGNDIKLSKMPGVLNLHHDAILDETVKDRVKDVSVEFGKQEIDGEMWMTETFRNVPQDIAKSIQTHFPGRSVELLPLTNPDTGVKYPMVVRSTAFLDKWTAPAVKGQKRDITVEFAEGESPIIVLFSGTEYQQSTQGAENMGEETKKEEKKTPDVSELKEKEAQIKELQKKKAQDFAMIKEMQAKQEAAEQAVIELQKKQNAAEVREFMSDLGHKTLQGEHSSYNVSAAFLEVIEPIISGTGRQTVIELAKGSQPMRKTLEDVFTKIVELAGKGALLVPVTEMGAMQHKEPGNENNQSILEQAQEIQAAQKISYSTALLQAQRKGGK